MTQEVSLLVQDSCCMELLTSTVYCDSKVRAEPYLQSSSEEALSYSMTYSTSCKVVVSVAEACASGSDTTMREAVS